MISLNKSSIRERFVGISLLILIAAILVLNIYKDKGTTELQYSSINQIGKDLSYVIGTSVSEELFNKNPILLEAKINNIVNSVSFIHEIIIQGTSDEIITLVRKEEDIRSPSYFRADIYSNSLLIGNVRIGINTQKFNSLLTYDQQTSADNLIYISLITVFLIILLVNFSIIDPLESVMRIIQPTNSESKKHANRPQFTIEQLKTETINLNNNRIKNENLLDATKKQLTAVLNTVGEAIITIDIDSNIIMANKAAEELWGYSAKAIKNTNLTLMMPERFREMHTNGLNNYVNTGVSRIINRRVEVVGLHANGFEFPMDLFISETLIDNKINFTAAVRNITKRKKERQLLLDSKKSTEVMLAEKTKKLMDAQMLLIQSEKQETIGILAAGVAHEVKNPLAIIQLGIDYLRQVIKSSPEKTETLDDMNDAVKRADSVIKELMDFSAARNLKKESVNMRMVVDESIRLTSHELVKSKIKTDVIFSDNDVTINIDKQKIIQVLINIIMNSIHAMGENDGVIKFRGKIMKGEGVDFDISASRLQKGPLFILMIEDTGPGVEKDKLDKISEPFYTSKKSGEGTGLGLAITENIIQLHNAKIVLYNVEDGGFGVKLIFNMYPGEYYENT